MFRKPRDNVKPATGRPPSPLLLSSLSPNTRSEMTTKTAPLTPAPYPPAIAPNATNYQAKQKSAGKNSSILSFFKKADPYDRISHDSLFVDETSPQKSFSNRLLHNGREYDEDTKVIGDINDSQDLEDDSRFNEGSGSSKRRRLSLPQSDVPETALQHKTESKSLDQRGCSPPPPAIPQNPARNHEAPVRSSGPFLDDSDSDDDNPFAQSSVPRTNFMPTKDNTLTDKDNLCPVDEPAEREIPAKQLEPPSLERESTSLQEHDDFAEFEGLEDFDDDYTEGDEFMEKRWQRAQRRLELEEQGFEGDFDEEDLEGLFPNDVEQSIKEEELSLLADAEQSAPKCPVCSVSFAGVSDQEASVHVNHCLDGNPTPLPNTTASTDKTESAPNSESRLIPPKFRRPVRPAKPGQDNPFNLGQANGTSSAFSKLMSGHAEDAAWATAAAAEHASRGKPAYQRTCPFYKILPGFNICVDAFRYGAVEGCNAYFLSHFHSDHYIGLTSTWSHGPIYCSRPTANLVRQQLRVDPKWVVDVEFEKKIKVPGTNGVHVTMIPANHCPGSSLYLFEKVIGKGKTPKVQRVLHCGDFRACPAHVEHPLLKPDVLDCLTGRTAQQKLDVCYLDTTYMNPRYAFPSQEDVIQACADKCVSMNKPKSDAKDGARPPIDDTIADSGMADFIRKTSATEEIPPIITTTNPSPAAPLGTHPGRLLIVVGTYSIGKERICLGIARALSSKIYAPPGKRRICACLEDPELSSRLTSDPRAAQVHMTPLFEIRAETVSDYLALYRDTFSRAVGFRPSGWNYRPPGSRFTESPAVGSVLFSGSWRSAYGVRDLVPQRGSSARCATFGVPYSEHSSFRELTMFCCALRIDKIIPTVNVGNAKSRERMKQWVERWNTYKKKEGLFRVAGEGPSLVAAGSGEQDKGKGDWYAGKGTWELRTTL